MMAESSVAEKITYYTPDTLVKVYPEDVAFTHWNPPGRLEPTDPRNIRLKLSIDRKIKGKTKFGLRQFPLVDEKLDLIDGNRRVLIMRALNAEKPKNEHQKLLVQITETNLTNPNGYSAEEIFSELNNPDNNSEIKGNEAFYVYLNSDDTLAAPRRSRDEIYLFELILGSRDKLKELYRKRVSYSCLKEARTTIRYAQLPYNANTLEKTALWIVNYRLSSRMRNARSWGFPPERIAEAINKNQNITKSMLKKYATL
jgi:hypothetical protein